MGERRERGKSERACERGERRERVERSLCRGECARKWWVRGEREASERERAREARGVKEVSSLSLAARVRERGL